jgi:outer membrane receptor protein involved in Fe transport
VGIKQGFKLGGFMGYLDAVAFQQDFEDYVEFTFGQWKPFTFATAVQDFYGLGFKSVNTGGARVTGLELELAGKGKLGKVEVQVLMGYTTTKPVSTTPDYVYAERLDVPITIIPSPSFTNSSYNPEGDILKFRIRNTFRADAQLSYRRVFAGASARYNSHVQNIDRAFVDLDAGPPQPDVLPTGITGWMAERTSGGVWIADARLGMHVSRQVRMALIVNNLTNEVYALRPLSIEAPRSFQVQLSAGL